MATCSAEDESAASNDCGLDFDWSYFAKPTDDAAEVVYHLTQSVEKLLKKIKENGEKTFTVVVVGKTGCGKSSLIGDIIGPKVKKRPKVGGGKEPVTTETETYRVKVNDVWVDVCDTRGMFDIYGGDHEKETIKLVKEICTRERSGVIVVCMEMHCRMDTSTAKMLCFLHENCAPDVWRFTLIALTKANMYPADDWLQTKEKNEKNKVVLMRKFDKCLADSKMSLLEQFTKTDDIKDSCRIGMSKETYEALQIPIVPVARLNSEDNKKMDIIGHDTWFNCFLLHCITREKGIGLVTIHKSRLSYLPQPMLEEFLKQQRITPEMFEDFKRFLRMNTSFGSLFVVISIKIFWWWFSNPRFDSRSLPM